MKLKSDPRHLKRAKIISKLYSWNFQPDQKPPAQIKSILARLDQIDNLIAKSAPTRPLNQINRIDLAILRLAVFELIINKQPQKVIIDEAIELGKQYGSDSSASFINGALGQVLKLKK